MSATPAPAAAAAPASAEETKQIFRLNLLETIKVAQMQHGIRHDDYNRYRQYCARKLRRLRMGLEFKHGRKEFKRKVIEPKMVVDLRFLMIPLFNAERAWSYAMALKQEFSEDNPRPRFHLYRRLAKAVRHAQELSKLCVATADPRSQLEAEAYAAWMQGSYMLEREQWGPSQASFTHALNVFSKLAKIGDAENQALCEERVAAIQPSLRYCEYMSKRTGGGSSDDSRALQEIQKGLDEALQAKLEHIINESRKTQQESMAHVEWQGQKVSVKEGKVRLQLLEAQDLERSLTESKSDKEGAADEVQRKLEVYSKLLACFDEALQALRDDLREAEKGAKGGASKVTAQSLMQLRDYITFRKLSANNDRNLLMAEDWANTFAAQEAGERPKGKKVKADDIVHLFEKMVQNCNEVLAVGNSAADAKIKQDIDSQVTAYVCLRCFYLAESYRVVPKYAEAYALYGRAKELSQSALQQRQAAAPKDTRLLNWLKTVQTDSEIRKHVVHATAILEREDGVSKIQEGLAKAKLDDEKKDERTLLERLDSFEAGTASSQFQLVHVPPNYVTVPCKPILFDLAFNFAEFVPIDKRAVAPAPKPAPAPKQSASAPKQPAQQPKQQQQQQKKGGATPAPAPAPAAAATPAPAAAAASAAQPDKPAEKQGGGWFGFLRR